MGLSALSSTCNALARRLQVQPTDDEFEALATTRWGNRDVYPVSHDKRTYGVLAFYAYWGTCGISLSSWTIGSSLIGIGLTAGQACGVVVCASFPPFYAPHVRNWTGLGPDGMTG